MSARTAAPPPVGACLQAIIHGQKLRGTTHIEAETP